MSSILLLLLAIFCPFGFTQDATADPTQESSTRPFTIRRDPLFPTSRLTVDLPPKHPLYSSFETKVDDVTEGIDSTLRDAERTLPVSDQLKLFVDNLHAGHKYSVAVWGLKEGKRELIKEETVSMEPVAPNFAREDVTAGTNNITLLTTKEHKSVQDSFLIEYRQIDPEKKYPILEVLDIPEQRQLEVYLGNLNPGGEYSVRVTAVRNGRRSKPWSSTVSTKPLAVSHLKAKENGSCVTLFWEGGDGGVDTYSIVYGSEKKLTTVNATTSPVQLCEEVTPGLEAQFTVTPVKGQSRGDARSLTHILRPLSPTEFHVIPDLNKGKYRINVDLPPGSQYERCKVTAVGESLQKIEAEAAVDAKNGNHVCFLLLELPPGERFEISVLATSHAAASTKLTRTVVLTPAFDMKSFGLTLQEARGGLELLWPQSETFLSRVKDLWGRLVGPDSLLQLRVTALSTKERQRQFETTPVKANEPIMVSSLTKGGCYKIQAYTVTKSGIVSEHRLDEMKRMSAPPVNVSLTEVTRTSSTLTLTLLTDEEPLNECQLSVGVLDMHSQTVLDKRLPLTRPLPSIQLNGLRPFHKYTVNTQIVCGAGSSECSPTTRTMRQISFSTKQDRPGPVQSFTGRALNPYTVQLGWLPPALPNGVLTHYVAEVKPLDDKTQASWTVSVGMNSERTDHALETLVDGLVGGQRYNFTVRAVTEAGPGDFPTPLTITMPLLAPPRPTVAPTTIPESVGPHTVSVRYTSAMFDPKHGKIVRCALIVTEVTETGEVSETWMRTENRTYSWSQVQRFDVWPAYTAKLLTVPVANRLSAPTVLSESIGSDSCSERPSDEICNGPLKAGSLYKFRLRLYTAPDLFTDSPYSEVIATDQSAVGVSLLTAVVFVALGLIVVGLSAVLIFFFCCSRGDNKARQAAYSSSKESQWAALKMIMAERAADCLAKLGLDATSPDAVAPQANHLQPGFGHHRRCRSLRERTGVDHRLERLPSGPLHKTPLQTVLPGFNIYKNRPIRKTDFELHVRNMSADSEFRFSEEYEAMKNIGVGQSCQAADYPINRPKNRFTNILPYDHSRVKLLNIDGEEGSDYVNANYIPGFSNRREFIAAQGPLPTTRDAFWQMAWEQQCPAIIALTKCVEKGRDKCHQYWPDQDRVSVTYGDIEVTMMFETKYDEFTVRQLRLTHLGENVAPRNIWHFHYMAWPDFGVPEHPDGIIRFAQLFRNKLPHSPHNKPTVVHCSAGVGRSGTFVTIDRLLQTIQQDRPIDVFGIVYEMRLERCHMVQNEQQYIFIHHCILHALQTGSTGTRMLSPGSPADVHQNPAFEDDEGIAESGF